MTKLIKPLQVCNCLTNLQKKLALSINVQIHKTGILHRLGIRCSDISMNYNIWDICNNTNSETAAKTPCIYYKPKLSKYTTATLTVKKSTYLTVFSGWRFSHFRTSL